MPNLTQSEIEEVNGGVGLPGAGFSGAAMFGIPRHIIKGNRHFSG